MHSGNVAAMPDVRNAATFSFCHGSRPVRMMTAILVSNCMVAPLKQRHSGARRLARAMMCNCTSENPYSRSWLWILRCAIAHRSSRCARPGMTRKSPLGVAGPGADDAFLATEFVAFFGRGVERAGNLRLHRLAVCAAGIGHVYRR